MDEKAFSVTIEKKAETPVVYDYFLIKTTKDFLEIDLAQKNETAEKIELLVKESFAISADKMLQFCIDVFEALQQYEAKYQNHKGIPALSSEDEESE